MARSSCAALRANAETAATRLHHIDGRLQASANRAVRVGLIEYDRRHGWRGRPDTWTCRRTANRTTTTWWTSTPASATVAGHRGVGRREECARLREVLDRCRSSGRAVVGAQAAAQRNARPAPKDAGQCSARRRHLRRRDEAGTRSSADPGGAERAGGARSNDGSIVALVGASTTSQQVQPRHQARRLPVPDSSRSCTRGAREWLTPATVLLDAPIVLDANGARRPGGPRTPPRVRRADAPARGAGALA